MQPAQPIPQLPYQPSFRHGFLNLLASLLSFAPLWLMMRRGPQRALSELRLREAVGLPYAAALWLPSPNAPRPALLLPLLPASHASLPSRGWPLPREVPTVCWTPHAAATPAPGRASPLQPWSRP